MSVSCVVPLNAHQELVGDLPEGLLTPNHAVVIWGVFFLCASSWVWCGREGVAVGCQDRGAEQEEKLSLAHNIKNRKV